MPTVISRFLAASAFCLLAGNAIAIETAAGDDGWSSGSDQRQAHRIGKDFIGFAGSKENATALALGLRRGSEVTLTSADGTTTRFSPATGHMGHGNVSKAMALAQRQLAAAGIRHPTPEQIESALNGGTVTARDGATIEMQGILQLRSQGMGWGKIAHTVGVKPGQGFKPLPAHQVNGHSGYGYQGHGSGIVDGHGSRGGMHAGYGTRHDGIREPLKVEDGGIHHQHSGGHRSGVVTAAGGSPMHGGDAGMHRAGRRGDDGMHRQGTRHSGVVTAAGGAPVSAGEWQKGNQVDGIHRHGGRAAGAGIVTAAGGSGSGMGATRMRHSGGGGGQASGAGVVTAGGGSAVAASSAVRSAGGHKGNGHGRGRGGKD
jgi:hypothetical protein